MGEQISRSEWLKAYEEAQNETHKDDPSCLTVEEYAKLMGLASSTARNHLKVLEASGKAVRTSKYYQRSGGAWLKTAAWKLKKKS